MTDEEPQATLQAFNQAAMLLGRVASTRLRALASAPESRMLDRIPEQRDELVRILASAAHRTEDVDVARAVAEWLDAEATRADARGDREVWAWYSKQAMLIRMSTQAGALLADANRPDWARGAPEGSA